MQSHSVEGSEGRRVEEDERTYLAKRQRRPQKLIAPAALGDSERCRRSEMCQEKLRWRRSSPPAIAGVEGEPLSVGRKVCGGRKQRWDGGKGVKVLRLTRDHTRPRLPVDSVNQGCGRHLQRRAVRCQCANTVNCWAKRKGTWCQEYEAQKGISVAGALHLFQAPKYRLETYLQRRRLCWC